MRHLLFLVLIVLLSVRIAYSQNKQSCLQLDIVLVGDLSGSVSGHEAQVTEAFEAFIDRFQLSDLGIRIGVVTFGSNSTIHTPLTSNKQKLKQVVLELGSADGTTNLTSALEAAFNIFQDPNDMIKRDVPKLIILVTDGEADNKDQAAALSEQMQRILNIGVCGILINTGDNSESYLKSITSPFCNKTVTNYNFLVETMKQMDICL